jgi:glucokinase
MLVYAIDIGGSSVKHGLVDVGSEEVRILETFAPLALPSLEFSDLKALLFSAVRSTTRTNITITVIGISTTGTVDASGTVVSAGHFTGYRDISWSDLIKVEFPQVKVVRTVNDGRASAWAEYAASPVGIKSQIHAVVGTGVGGGIVHNGELLFGDSGQAGYIGHIKLTTEETPTCSCGSQGCAEVLASAPAIMRYFNQFAGLPEPSGSSLDTVISEARSGNKAALAAFETAGHWLGLALGNAMNVLNPSVVSVGGGAILASESIYSRCDGGPYLHAVSKGVLASAHRRVAASAQLRQGHFGNDGGMIGAARIAAVHATLSGSR